MVGLIAFIIFLWCGMHFGFAEVIMFASCSVLFIIVLISFISKVSDQKNTIIRAITSIYSAIIFTSLFAIYSMLIIGIPFSLCALVLRNFPSLMSMDKNDNLPIFICLAVSVPIMVFLYKKTIKHALSFLFLLIKH